MNQANGGGFVDPNHVRNTFNVGAALIDQYDTDDLNDPDRRAEETDQAATLLRSSTLSATAIPQTTSTGSKACHSTIRMSICRDRRSRRIRQVSRQAPCFSTGVLRMSASLVTPITRVLLRPVKPSISRLRQVMTSHCSISLLITRQVRAQVLSILTREMARFSPQLSEGRFYTILATRIATNASLVSQPDALAAGQAIVQETTQHRWRRVEPGRCCPAGRGSGRSGAWNLAGSDEAKQTIARALAEASQARTWNLMIDVIAQTG